MFKKRIRNVCCFFLVCGANVWAEATEGGGNGGEGDGSGGDICEFYSGSSFFGDAFVTGVMEKIGNR